MSVFRNWDDEFFPCRPSSLKTAQNNRIALANNPGVLIRQMVCRMAPSALTESPDTWVVVMAKTLTIALPAKNEPGIAETLVYLARAVTRLPSDVNVETLVCVNGSNDNTLPNAREVAASSYGQLLGLRVIESDPGKIVAQREILNQRRFGGAMVSIDSDVKVNAQGVRAVYDSLMRQKDEVSISYAQVLPEIDAASTSLQFLYADSCRLRRTYMPPAPWVHGRLYGMTKKALGLIYAEHHIDERIANTKLHPLARQLALHKGPTSDDKFATRVVCDAVGREAIAKVPEAQASFIPPADVKQLFLAARRSAIELARLDILFPEHAHIQKGFERDMAAAASELMGRVRAEDVMPHEVQNMDFAVRLEQTLAAFVAQEDLQKPQERLAEKVEALMQHPAIQGASHSDLRAEVDGFFKALQKDYAAQTSAAQGQHWVALQSTKPADMKLGEAVMKFMGQLGRLGVLAERPFGFPASHAGFQPSMAG